MAKQPSKPPRPSTAGAPINPSGPVVQPPYGKPITPPPAAKPRPGQR
jgi:hypothetical protein